MAGMSPTEANLFQLAVSVRSHSLPLVAAITAPQGTRAPRPCESVSALFRGSRHEPSSRAAVTRAVVCMAPESGACTALVPHVGVQT